MCGLRRCGGISPGFDDRSALGHASSNEAGGGSAGSVEGAAGGSLVRVCARSRSFRELEENNRLRFGFGGGGGAASGNMASEAG